MEKCKKCGGEGYKQVNIIFPYTVTLCKKCYKSFMYWSYKWPSEP